MTSINATNFRKGLFGYLDQAVVYNDVISVSTKNGSAVVMSEEDYNSLMDTLYLCSIPGMRESILEGADTPLEKCPPEGEVPW